MMSSNSSGLRYPKRGRRMKERLGLLVLFCLSVKLSG